MKEPLTAFVVAFLGYEGISWFLAWSLKSDIKELNKNTQGTQSQFQIHSQLQNASSIDIISSRLSKQNVAD